MAALPPPNYWIYILVHFPLFVKLGLLGKGVCKQSWRSRL